jgi:hypothetical protein
MNIMSHGQSKSNKPKQQPTVAEEVPKVLRCRLGGVELNCWFDDNGDLCEVGPPEAQAKIDAFVSLYRPLLNNKEVVECIDKLEPIGREHRSIKQFAVLDLVIDAQMRSGNPREEIALTPEQIERRVRLLQELPEID